MRADREKEWDEFVSSWAARGWPLPDGSLISGFLEIGFKRMDVFIERLFETEKTAISKEAGTPSPKYFGDLAEEFKTIFQQEVSVIRSRAFQYTQGTRGPVSQSIIATVAHKEASIREATNRKVQIMEQELKLGIFKPVTYQTIQVTGDVAVINTGQVYGSIHARLERLSGTEPSQLVEAFSRISQAIKDSNVDDQVKCEQLQNIELLVE
jgi:hypothetical protein